MIWSRVLTNTDAIRNLYHRPNPYSNPCFSEISYGWSLSMITFANKKNKIVLSDYNYKRDIENRLLMANLTIFEVDLLREIINGSLKTSVKHLAEVFDTKEDIVIVALDNLAKSKVFKRQNDAILVDKEIRKYYESQIIKFSDDFEPGMDFLQGLLSKVPIHALPQWYVLPRTADNIFGSIIEKYLSTPKSYQRYLAELQFDSPVLNKIIDEVMTAPDFKVCAKKLIQKHKLTREKFEECMLHLEYNFVCCLGYFNDGEKWEEIVQPYGEWAEYLRFIRDTHPPQIETSKVKKDQTSEFEFMASLNTVLEAMQKKPVSTPLSAKLLPSHTPEYREQVVEKLLQLHLAELKGKLLHPTINVPHWLENSLQEQAITLYRLQGNCMSFMVEHNYTQRDVREAEKCLRRVANSGWVPFDAFVKGMTRPIGKSGSLQLTNRGKRWRYTIPTYTPNDITLVEKTIFERLFQTGMVQTGTYKGKPCFCLTPLGKATLAD